MENFKNLLLNNKEIKTKDLYELGYNYNDIKAFIRKGILINVKRGVYTLTSLNSLNDYINEANTKKWGVKSNLK